MSAWNTSARQMRDEYLLEHRAPNSRTATNLRRLVILDRIFRAVVMTALVAMVPLANVVISKQIEWLDHTQALRGQALDLQLQLLNLEDPR